MFAPKVAKAQTSTTNSLTSGLASKHSVPVEHRYGRRPVEQVLWLQRTIGNQATLRLLAQRASSLPKNERNDQNNQETKGPAPTPPVLSFDFSKIPVFPNDRPNRSQVPSSLPAVSPPGAIQPKLIIGEVNDPL